MNYDNFVADLVERSGVPDEVVRKVLFHMPDALLQMEVGASLRTPLGVFRMAQTSARPITLPDQTTKAEVPARTTVKLKSGSRLKIES